MSGFGVTKEQLCELMTADAETQKAMLKQFGGVAGVTEALKVNPEVGLSDGDVRSGSRASAFGANTLPDPPSKSFFELLWEGTEDGTIRILTVAALISLFLGIFFPPEGEESVAWIEGAAILVAVVLVIFVGAANNYSKEQQFKELDKQKETKPVELIRNGSETEISSDDLVVGDIVLLKQGERIPGDCLYIDGRGTSECKIDTSVMTGETVAVTVNSGSPIMLSGTILDEGLARAVVIAVGESSQYGILFKNLQADNPETPLEQKLETLADWIGYGGLGAAIVLFGVLLAFFLIEQYTGVHTLPHCIVLDQPFSKVCWFMEQDPDWGPHAVQRITEIFIMAITIVVVAVPEGLPLAVTLSLAYSMKQMMQDNCLVRRLASCETMGGATTICSDKTGTLTENRMTVTKGTIGDQVFESMPPSFPISKQMLQLLCDGIAINSKANVAAPKTKEIGALPVFTGNKTECALLVYAAALQPGYAYHAVRKDAEQHTVRLFNFNSDRKRMSTVVRLPSEEVPFRMYTKGASEVIVERCSRVMTSDGTVRELSEKDITLFNEFINTMADEGLRTIGIGFRDFADVEEITPIEGDADWEPPENDLILLSIVGIMDPIRKEVPGAVRTCQEAGILVRVVTGDNPKTATKIAHDCGILREGGVVLTGPEFRKMSDQELDRVLPRLQVLARSIPSDKKRLVERLMANGEVVAATGDGTNDGPALKAAHVGLAMGLSGTDVAKQASDIVILDDNFKSIVLAVMWGRCVYDNIKKFLQFQLTVNVAAVSVALLAALTDRGTPLAAIQLLWVNLIMDTFAALALGTEKPTPDLLTRKPYGLDEKVPISRVMWRNIIGQSIYQIAVLLVLIYLGAELLGLPDMSAYHYTLVFNTFVWMQLFNEINSRKVNNEWNIFENFFGNWMFAAILVLTAGVQVIIIELGGEVMKTAHQDWREWGLAIGLGVISIPLGFIIRLIPVGDPSQMAPEAVEERKPLLTGKEKMRSFGGEKESKLDLEAPGDEHGWGDKGKKVY